MMKPIDFVLFNGGSSPNTPVLDIYEAMKKPIIIRTAFGEMVVLSYYYDDIDKVMVMDIEQK